MASRRTWLRFSLRTLIVAMTVAGIGFGLMGRGAVLERRAQFHDAAYMRLTDAATDIYIAKRRNQTIAKSLEESVGNEEAAQIKSLIDRAQWHRRVVSTLRHARFRPWEAAFWSNSPLAQNDAK